MFGVRVQGVGFRAQAINAGFANETRNFKDSLTSSNKVTVELISTGKAQMTEATDLRKTGITG